MTRFSWHRHLVERGQYADWVDRGRLRPSHRRWSTYLRAVAEKAEAEVIEADVVGLELEGERWRLSLAEGALLVADGVVLTGAGPAIGIAGRPRGHPRVLDGRSYWLHEKEFKKHFSLNVSVIGSGETAASIVISLLKKLHKGSTVDVLTSRGVLTPAGRASTRTASTPIPATGHGWPRRTAASSWSAPTAASSRSRPRRR
jgi:mycobactin lysine-N-oxygenase